MKKFDHVLSLKQPWAGLLVLGIKKFETRPWQTGHRGDIAIHSSASKMTPDAEELLWMVQNKFPKSFQKDSLNWRICTTYGAILGRCNLYAIYPTLEGVKIGDSSFGVHAPISQLEYDLGDFGKDRFYWKMNSPEVFKEPIPAKGKLSIWSFNG